MVFWLLIQCKYKFTETLRQVYTDYLSRNLSLHLNVKVLLIPTCSGAVSKYSWYNASSNDAQSRSCSCGFILTGCCAGIGAGSFDARLFVAFDWALRLSGLCCANNCSCGYFSGMHGNM